MKCMLALLLMITGYITRHLKTGGQDSFPITISCGCFLHICVQDKCNDMYVAYNW